MNNKELISELSLRTGYSQQATRKMVATLLDDLLSRCAAEQTMTIPHFGTFEVKKRLERVVTAPNTSRRLLVPPKLVFSFRPATSYKESITQQGGNDE